MAVRKTEIAMGDYIKSDLERVGDEWKTDRKNWRQLTESVVRGGRKMIMEVMVISPLTTVMPRK